MNEEKMIKVLARVEDEATRFARHEEGAVGFNMASWWDPTSTARQNVTDDDPRSEVCGTTACLAGHAVLMEGYRIGLSARWRRTKGLLAPEEVERVAARILGIGNMSADQSPFYLNDLDWVYEWVADKMGITTEVLREKVRAEQVYE